MPDVENLRGANCRSANLNPLCHFVVLALVIGIAGLTTSCGSGLQSTNSANSSSVNPSAMALSLTPDGATVASLQQLQFTARISGTANTAVTWEASAGSISNNGVFTAPKVAGNTPVVITATSRGDGPESGTPHVPVMDAEASGVSTHASATVTVVPQNSLAIVSSVLPPANVSVAYSAPLTAIGGKTPYQWSVSGSLPSGIQLQNGTGVIAGIAAQAGSYPLTAKVTDASGRSATATFDLTVTSVSSSTSPSGFDGPAELPRIYINSAMSNSPAPGSTISVNAGADLQSALNNADCGDIIQLQAGATFTGAFMFPAKNCDGNHWIIVRTSADDSSLPAEGIRLTPCYAGVSSLPGRPAFNCTSTSNVLARLLMPATGEGPVVFASGASHYRLIGLEITRAAGTGRVDSLWSVANGGTADHLILDRVWMHGTAHDETTRGVWLQGTTWVSVVDSFLTDFHCVAKTGICTDAQTIAGGVGSGPMGPYKIMDNFLEASGENIIFGGGTATGTPTDIQVSRNHLYKPLIWMKGQPGFVGGKDGNPFIVKNLFELKNAQRVVLDGNILENNWGGFTQLGFAILVTPKNQEGATGNLCPICQVTDVTIRYNAISHVGAGLQIANALSGSGVGAPLDGQRYSFHDLVIDDIDGVKYNGPGELAQISVSAGAPPLQKVGINHLTAFPSHTLFVIGNMVSSTPPMRNFEFTNSIVNAGTYPVWSSGGGPGNCAYRDNPLTTFKACFTSSVFARNAIIAASSNFPPANWPSGNFFPLSAESVDFVNYNGGVSGDYRLMPSSPYKGKATDGKDLGADMDILNLAIAGVE